MADQNTSKDVLKPRLAKLKALETISTYFGQKEKRNVAPSSSRPATAERNENAGSSSSSTGIRKKDGSVIFDLEDNRRVTVQKFRGEVYVDIRWFYPKGDDLLPGKKGITLNVEQWRKMIGMAQDVNKVLSDIVQSQPK